MLLADNSSSGSGSGTDEPDDPPITNIWQNNQLTETFSATGQAADYVDTGFVPFSADNTVWTIIGRVSKTGVQPTEYASAFCEADTPGNFGLKASVYDGSWCGQVSGVAYLMLKITGNWGNNVAQFIPVTDITGDYIDFAFVRNGTSYAIYYNGTLGAASNLDVNTEVTEHLLIGASWNRLTESAFRQGTFNCPFFKVSASALTQAEIAAEFAAIV